MTKAMFTVLSCMFAIALTYFVMSPAYVFVRELLYAYIATHGIMAFISNLVIGFLGIPAIYLSQSKTVDTQRWASVLGLTAQPFWFIMAYTSDNWGVFVMCFFYTHAWYTGFHKFWIKPYRAGHLP